MKKLLTIGFLISWAVTLAQPTGYINGTDTVWVINGSNHGYFQSGTINSATYIIVNWMGDGQTVGSPSTFDDNAIEKWVADGGVNWNGIFNFTYGSGASGSANFVIFSIPNKGSNYIPDYTTDLRVFWDSMISKGFDTSQHQRIVYAGLSGGVGRCLAYICNTSSVMTSSDPAWKFRRINGVGLFLSGCLFGADVTDSTQHMRSFVWGGSADVTCVPSAQAALYGDLGGTKRYLNQTGGNHSGTTWDSAWSLSATRADRGFMPFIFGEWIGRDSLIQKTVIRRENIVEINASVGHSADSIIALVETNYDPHRGTGSDDSRSSLLVSDITSYKGVNQARQVHIKWAKRQDFKYLYAKIAGTGVDTLYGYWHDNLQTIKGSNAFDFIAKWKADSTAMLNQADFRIITTASAGWIEVPITRDTAQYLLLCSSLNESHQTSVVKLVPYSYELTSGEETTFKPLTTTQVRVLDTARRQTIGQMTGANFPNFSKVDYQKYNGQKRDYASWSGFFTNDTLKYSSSNQSYLANVKAGNTETKIYFTFTDGPVAGHRPYNSSSLSGYFPEHYTQFASGLKQLAHINGRNMANPGYIKSNNPITEGYGQNLWHRIDIINESNGTFQANFYMNPIRAAAMTSKVIDSVWAGDSTMLIELGGAAGADVEYQRAILRLLQMKKGDTIRQRLAVVGLHKYPVSNRALYDWTLPQRIIGSHVVQPMDLGYYQENYRYNYQIWQEVGYPVYIDINEDGADMGDSSLTPRTVNGQNDTSLYNAPHYHGGYTPKQNQGIYLISSIIYHCESPTKYAAIYWWMDIYPFAHQSYQNSGMLQQYGNNWEAPDSAYFFASYYMVQGMAKRFKDWYCVQVLDTTNGGRHLSKWRKIGSTDSVLYILNRADTNNTAVTYTATGLGASAAYWTPRMTDSAKNDFNVNGSQAAATVTSGTVSMSTGVMPIFLVGVDAGVAVGSTEIRYRRRRIHN